MPAHDPPLTENKTKLSGTGVLTDWSIFRDFADCLLIVLLMQPIERVEWSLNLGW